MHHNLSPSPKKKKKKRGEGIGDPESIQSSRVKVESIPFSFLQKKETRLSLSLFLPTFFLSLPISDRTRLFYFFFSFFALSPFSLTNIIHACPRTNAESFSNPNPWIYPLPLYPLSPSHHTVYNPVSCYLNNRLQLPSIPQTLLNQPFHPTTLLPPQPSQLSGGGGCSREVDG